MSDEKKQQSPEESEKKALDSALRKIVDELYISTHQHYVCGRCDACGPTDDLELPCCPKCGEKAGEEVFTVYKGAWEALELCELCGLPALEGWGCPGCEEKIQDFCSISSRSLLLQQFKELRTLIFDGEAEQEEILKRTQRQAESLKAAEAKLNGLLDWAATG